MWLVLLAAGTLGWVVASVVVAAAHHWAMPTPECVRPDRRVVIDRTTSTVPLSIGPDDARGRRRLRIAGTVDRPARLLHRAKGRSRSVLGRRVGGHLPEPFGAREFQDKLKKYVAGGGKLLVIDSPENTSSMANCLLWPFGLSIHQDRHGRANRLRAASCQ